LLKWDDEGYAREELVAGFGIAPEVRKDPCRLHSKLADRAA
jgi:hypothetical protein